MEAETSTRTPLQWTNYIGNHALHWEEILTAQDDKRTHVQVHMKAAELYTHTQLEQFKVKVKAKANYSSHLRVCCCCSLHLSWFSFKTLLQKLVVHSNDPIQKKKKSCTCRKNRNQLAPKPLIHDEQHKFNWLNSLALLYDRRELSNNCKLNLCPIIYSQNNLQLQQ